jgi:methylated-DNA-[protein]-cysteine S-methyltransferase
MEGGGMPLQEEHAVISSPIGRIALDSDGVGLTAVRLKVKDPLKPPIHPLLKRAAEEIGEYFRGARRSFSAPLHRPDGATAFQRRIWDALAQIPYGTTRTYGDLARELSTSPRAVGGACARNALPLLVPCHRVVAKSGLGGFSGDWQTGLAIDVKKVLLDLEAKGSTPQGPRC